MAAIDTLSVRQQFRVDSAQAAGIAKSVSTGEREDSSVAPELDAMKRAVSNEVSELKVVTQGLGQAKGVTMMLDGSLEQMDKYTATQLGILDRLRGVMPEDARKSLTPQFEKNEKNLENTAADAKYIDRNILNGEIAGGNGIVRDENGVMSDNPAYSRATYTVTPTAVPGSVIPMAGTLKLPGLDVVISATAATTTFETLSQSQKATLSFGATMPKTAVVAATTDVFSIDPTTDGQTAAPINVRLLVAGKTAGVATAASYTASMFPIKEDMTGIEAATRAADIVNNNVEKVLAEVSVGAGLTAAEINTLRVAIQSTATVFAAKGMKASVLPNADGTAKLVLERIDTVALAGKAFTVKVGSTLASVVIGGANEPKARAIATVVTGLQIGDNQMVSTAGVTDPATPANVIYTTSAKQSDVVSIAGNRAKVGKATLAGVAGEVNQIVRDAATNTRLEPITKAKLGELNPSYTAASADVRFVSKTQGVGGFFMMQNVDGINTASAYDSKASGGSLAVSSVSVSGSLKPGDIIKTISGSAATTGFQTITTGLLALNTEISFGGRMFKLVDNVSDANTDILAVMGEYVPGTRDRQVDQTETLRAIVRKFNQSADPTLRNFQFEFQTTRAAGMGAPIDNQLKITARGQSADFNGMTFAVVNPALAPTATGSRALPFRLSLDGGAAQGLDLARITDNAGFHGVLKGFSAEFVGDNNVKLRFQNGGKTYEGVVGNTNPNTDTVIVMRSNQDVGGKFYLTIAGGHGVAVTDSLTAAAFAGKFNQALETLTFTQTERISNFRPELGSSVYGAVVEITSDKFNDSMMNIAGITVQSAGATNDATITITTADGTVYRNRKDAIGANVYTGKRVELVSDDANKKFTVIFGTEISLTSDADAMHLQNDFEKAFRIQNSPMQFSVGGGSKFAVEVADVRLSTFLKNKNITPFKVRTVDDAERMRDIYVEYRTFLGEVRAKVGADLAAIKAFIDRTNVNSVSLTVIRDIFGKIDISEALSEFQAKSDALQTAGFVMTSAKRINQQALNALLQ